MKKLRQLTLTGQPYDIGYQHGLAYKDEIIAFTKLRVELCSSSHWTGHSLPRQRVLELAEACIPAHNAYAPELMEEVRGTANATGLSIAELIIVNGYTDFIDLLYNSATPEPAHAITYAHDDCTAFIVPNERSANGQGFYGQTWDMNLEATPHVLLVRTEPEGQPASLAFTITGCVGMIGMNDAGIAIGINNLMGSDGRIGVTWPFVVRKALAQTNIDEALACITDANLVGAHNYLLFDKQGNGYNVEATATAAHIDAVTGEPIVHTNHCLLPDTLANERNRPPASQAGSEARLAKATTILGEAPPTPESLMQLTRDQEAICVDATPPFNVETCGAAIMRPATGDFWAVWGKPTENEYEHFTI